MNIDRHNYEMYFLLYVDNELSAEERNAVEKFVGENTDLKQELELLMQTAMPSEEIVFAAKSSLYKNEQIPDRLQEQMLLHLDNELEPLSLNSLSVEIDSNDDLKREWNILQQTKLDPNEKIIFENKRSLYRYERDKVISMRSWRAAAAILILGVSIFFGIAKFSKSKSEQNVASSGNKQQPAKKAVQPGVTNSMGKENTDYGQPPVENLASSKPDKVETLNKQNNNQQPEKNLVSYSSKDKSNKAVQKNIINTPVERRNINKNEIAVQEKNKNNLPKPYFENINNQNSNKTNSPIVQDNINTLQNKNDDVAVTVNNSTQSKAKEPKKIIEDSPLTETTNAYAKNAALDETASETGNNSVLFISEEKVNRSKVSGLFRKVKRVLTRNANIKTGNSVKIAGFEFAAR